MKLHGIKTAEIDRLARDYFKEIRNRSKGEIFDLCEELWKSGYIEESFIAGQWAYALRRQYSRPDFRRFEKWVKKYVNNWASCDAFGNHAIGAFIEMYPAYLERLKKWAGSKSRWVRRAAAVSLIVPARKGMFLENIFAIADLLLADKEDLVQKGYGWMLKVASRAHRREVFDYIMKRKTKMPRTALRYAIEKMPPALKTRAMAR